MKLKEAPGRDEFFIIEIPKDRVKLSLINSFDYPISVLHSQSFNVLGRDGHRAVVFDQVLSRILSVIRTQGIWKGVYHE